MAPFFPDTLYRNLLKDSSTLQGVGHLSTIFSSLKNRSDFVYIFENFIRDVYLNKEVSIELRKSSCSSCWHGWKKT